MVLVYFFDKLSKHTTLSRLTSGWPSWVAARRTMFLSLSVSTVGPLSVRSVEMCVMFPYPSAPPFFSSNEAFSSMYRSASCCRLLFLLAMNVVILNHSAWSRRAACLFDCVIRACLLYSGTLALDRLTTADLSPDCTLALGLHPQYIGPARHCKATYF